MRKARNILWIVFALSLLWVIVSPFIIEPPPPPEIEQCPDCPEEEPIILPSEGRATNTLAIITAITSLIGGVVTTIGTFRRDKLEGRKSELEARRTELELEERRLELEKKKLDAEIEIAKKQRELEELQKKDQQGGEK